MKPRATTGKLSASLAWFGYGLSVTVLALGLCWSLYAPFDYGYPFWYRALQIDSHIQEYGPRNRFQRPDFERLDAEQHQALFGDIRRAVHDGGDGLESIRYRDAEGRSLRLLRRAEILHLQDVARLIGVGRWLVIGAALAWLPLAWVVARRAKPPWRYRLWTAGTPLLAMVAWTALAGPKAVFYQFHIWLFPAEHDWFFYWQDSLMSTLMKAPVLFGGIAAVLLGGTLLLTPLLYLGGLWLARRGARQ